jgi:hypothetical protein
MHPPDFAIESIEPSRAAFSPASPTTITIRGKGFAPGSKVFLAGDEVNPQATEFRSANELRVTLPSGKGTVPVTVITPDGRVTTLQHAFTYA